MSSFGNCSSICGRVSGGPSHARGVAVNAGVVSGGVADGKVVELDRGGDWVEARRSVVVDWSAGE